MLEVELTVALVDEMVVEVEEEGVVEDVKTGVLDDSVTELLALVDVEVGVVCPLGDGADAM